ncbi:MAG TPA: hypothetical protein VEL69_07505 [Ktedonobacteraceae bacterium]|nr:hypothetical protein [Ktedonobacteraceae bacterium]
MRYIDQPLPLIIAGAFFGIALIGIVIFYGISNTTRGPIEMILALFLGSLVLLFRAVSKRRG